MASRMNDVELRTVTWMFSISRKERMRNGQNDGKQNNMAREQISGEAQENRGVSKHKERDDLKELIYMDLVGGGGVTVQMINA